MSVQNIPSWKMSKYRNGKVSVPVKYQVFVLDTSLTDIQDPSTPF